MGGGEGETPQKLYKTTLLTFHFNWLFLMEMARRLELIYCPSNRQSVTSWCVISNRSVWFNATDEVCQNSDTQDRGLLKGVVCCEAGSVDMGPPPAPVPPPRAGDAIKARAGRLRAPVGERPATHLSTLRTWRWELKRSEWCEWRGEWRWQYSGRSWMRQPTRISLLVPN